MTRLFALTAAAALALGTAARAQAPEPRRPVLPATSAASELADVLTRHVSEDLRANAVVGKPLSVGSVTIIPILMIDISFGGAGLSSPSATPAAAQPTAKAPGPTAPAPQALPPGADGFLMGGEARPLGFVVVSPQGTRFVSVAAAPAK